VSSGSGRLKGDDQVVVVLGPGALQPSGDLQRGGGLPGAVLASTARRTDFPDGEQLIELAEPGLVRGRHALIVHSTGPPQDANLMTLLQLVDAVRHSGAASVSCFVPYLCYQRQDRRVRAGEALTGPLVATVLASLGADLIMTVDKHSMGEGRQAARLANISAAPAFARFARDEGLAFDIVVSPDQGGRARGRQIARILGAPGIALDKHKSPERGTFYDDQLPRELAGRRCLIVDDLCSSGSSLDPLCDRLSVMGARVSVFVTHLLMRPEKLRARIPSIQTLAYSDSCGDPAAPVRLLPWALPIWADHLHRPALLPEGVPSAS
jgi:ribose-phosphate pyrophosphokinase